jgi:hypothetical protein
MRAQRMQSSTKRTRKRHSNRLQLPDKSIFIHTYMGLDLDTLTF